MGGEKKRGHGRSKGLGRVLGSCKEGKIRLTRRKKETLINEKPKRGSSKEMEEDEKKDNKRGFIKIKRAEGDTNREKKSGSTRIVLRPTQKKKIVQKPRGGEKTKKVGEKKQKGQTQKY